MFKAILTHFKTTNKVFSNVNFIRTYSSALEIKTTYSLTESNKILETINDTTSDDLSKYNISKNRLQKIEVWKRKHGKFTSLNDILEVEGFGIKVLDNFCKSIINNSETDPKMVKVVAKKTPQFTIPLLYEHVRTTIESCVSVHIGVSSVTWTKFLIHPDLPSEVTHWNHFDIAEKKLHLSDFVQIVLYIESMLPEANIYILENPQMAQPSAPGATAQVNINIQKSQLISMLSIILANRSYEKSVLNQEENSEDEESKKIKPQQNVLFLKPFLASRLFGLYIGNERVSTESVILDLLRVHYNVDDSDDLSNPVVKKEILSKINVPIDLRTYYSQTVSFQKEYLGQSLLMGLCFLRLCVLKCFDSIEIVTSRSRK